MPSTVRRRTIAALIVAAAPALASVAAAAPSLPAHVVAVEGQGNHGGNGVFFTYNTKTKTINGFSVDYTCGGAPVVLDQDLRTIAAGGHNDKALTRVRTGGRVKVSLTGDITRFSEDGLFPLGRGKLSIDATLKDVGGRVTLKGFLMVHDNAHRCASAYLTFSATGKS